MSQPPVFGAAAEANTRPPPAAGSCKRSCSPKSSPAKSAAPPPSETTSAASEGTPPACTVAPPPPRPAGTAPDAGTADATSATEPLPRRLSPRCKDHRPCSFARRTTAPCSPGAAAAETSSAEYDSDRSARVTGASARWLRTRPHPPPPAPSTSHSSTASAVRQSRRSSPGAAGAHDRERTAPVASSLVRSSRRKRNAAFVAESAAAPHPVGVDAADEVAGVVAETSARVPRSIAATVTLPLRVHSTRKSSPPAHPATASAPPRLVGAATTAVTSGDERAPSSSVSSGRTASPISCLTPASSTRATAILPVSTPAAKNQSDAPSAEATCTRGGDRSPATPGATSYSAYASGGAPPSVRSGMVGRDHACTCGVGGGRGRQGGGAGGTFPNARGSGRRRWRRRRAGRRGTHLAVARDPRGVASGVDAAARDRCAACEVGGAGESGSASTPAGATRDRGGRVSLALENLCGHPASVPRSASATGLGSLHCTRHISSIRSSARARCAA